MDSRKYGIAPCCSHARQDHNLSQRFSQINRFPAASVVSSSIRIQATIKMWFKDNPCNAMHAERLQTKLIGWLRLWGCLERPQVVKSECLLINWLLVISVDSLSVRRQGKIKTSWHLRSDDLSWACTTRVRGKAQGEEFKELADTLGSHES